ncbi:hypothetical protein AB0D42_26320 [Streptomyces sp. NPDC048304]|uniref:hypothetical protein n=1 Tax=Streptomyces sp. NPDC048304 TaxID=3154820 RepID=UPI0033FF4C31
MERILTGTAQDSNGALTIIAFAQEAQVPRNALTQRHPAWRTTSTPRAASGTDLPNSKYGYANKS